MSPEFLDRVREEMTRIEQEYENVGWFKEYMALREILMLNKIVVAVGPRMPGIKFDDGTQPSPEYDSTKIKFAGSPQSHLQMETEPDKFSNGMFTAKAKTKADKKAKDGVSDFNFADVVSTSHRKRDGNRFTAQEAAIVNACLRYSREQKDAINVRVLMGHLATAKVKRPEGFDTNDLFRLLKDSRCFRITPHGAFQSVRQFAGG